MSIKGKFKWRGKSYKDKVIRVRNAWGGAQDGQWVSIVDIYDAAELAQNPSPVPIETFTLTTPYFPGADPVREMYVKIKGHKDIELEDYKDV